MKRLMVALSAVTVAALLLWPPEAASYDENAAWSEKPAYEARGEQIQYLRAVIGIGPYHLRTIEITIDMGWRSSTPRCTSPAWGALAEGDGLLWKTAAAIRRRALERLSDLLLRRKTH
jgi:hypothetical protein